MTETVASLADAELDASESDPVSAAAIPCPVAIAAPKPTATAPAPNHCKRASGWPFALRWRHLDRRAALTKSLRVAHHSFSPPR